MVNSTIQAATRLLRFSGDPRNVVVPLVMVAHAGLAPVTIGAAALVGTGWLIKKLTR